MPGRGHPGGPVSDSELELLAVSREEGSSISDLYPYSLLPSFKGQGRHFSPVSLLQLFQVLSPLKSPGKVLPGPVPIRWPQSWPPAQVPDCV